MMKVITTTHKHRTLALLPGKDANREERRGAALVEFAVIAPLILTLILGIVEMGNALDISNKLTSAIREGGRLAAMDWTDVVAEGESPNDKVISDIRNFLAASGLPSEDIVLSITHAEGTSQGQLFDLADKDNMNKLFQISASIDYSDVCNYPAPVMGGQTIVASIILRAGRIQLTSN